MFTAKLHLRGYICFLFYRFHSHFANVFLLHFFLLTQNKIWRAVGRSDVFSCRLGQLLRERAAENWIFLQVRKVITQLKVLAFSELNSAACFAKQIVKI
jgi:hypothetical protein